MKMSERKPQKNLTYEEIIGNFESCSTESCPDYIQKGRFVMCGHFSYGCCTRSPIKKSTYLVGELYEPLKTMELTEEERNHYMTRGKLVIPICIKPKEKPQIKYFKVGIPTAFIEAMKKTLIWQEIPEDINDAEVLDRWLEGAYFGLYGISSTHDLKDVSVEECK